MTKDELLALVHAGFTKTEILKYFSPENPAPAPAPAPTPAPAPAPAPDPAPLDGQIAELKNLIAQAQALNLLQLQNPTPQPLTGEDALASLIDPPASGQ